MSGKNETLIRRVVDEVWNQKKPALIDEAFDAKYVVQTPNGELRGPAGYRQLYSTYATAFPDCRIKITDLFGEGDKLTLAYTFTGTHSGPLMGIAPSHKRVSVDGTAIMRFKGGKIVEERTIWDTLALMQQIGVVEPLEAEVA